VFNTTQQYFSYIMATSFSDGRSRYPERTTDRRPVLVVEEARVPGENHRPGQATGQSFSLVTDHGQATGKLYHLRRREPPTMGK